MSGPTSSNNSSSSRLRHRVTLQQPVLAADGAGGGTRTWTHIVTLWAEIIPVQPRTGGSQNVERSVDQHQQSSVFHKVTLRYRASVTPDMRLLYGTRILLIRQVSIVNERNAELHILAEEGPRMG